MTTITLPDWFLVCLLILFVLQLANQLLGFWLKTLRRKLGYTRREDDWK